MYCVNKLFSILFFVSFHSNGLALTQTTHTKWSPSVLLLPSSSLLPSSALSSRLDTRNHHSMAAFSANDPTPSLVSFNEKCFKNVRCVRSYLFFFFFLFQSYVPNEKRQKQEENELHETFNIAWMNLPIILLYISIRDNNFIIANTERRDQKFLDDFKNHWETYSGNIFLFFLRIAKLHVELVEHKKW